MTVDDAIPPLRASAHHDRLTGVDVRVDRVGRGEPVVFLNGLLGLNEHWHRVMTGLADQVECFFIQTPLLEMRGAGCSVKGVTRLVLSLLDTLVDEQPIIIGNSLGGHVALRVALARPELPRGLVLVGSSGLFERTFERDIERTPSRDWMSRKIGELFHERPAIFEQLVDDAHATLSRRSCARALVKMARSAKRDHLGGELGHVAVPCLLAWGRQDCVTPPEVAEQFLELLPDARLRWIESCGHAPQIECADELSRVISEFIDELDARRLSQAGGHGAA